MKKNEFRDLERRVKMFDFERNSIAARGPISKFQSPGLFIYIHLSISLLNSASGALDTLGSGILTNLGCENGKNENLIWSPKICTKILKVLDIIHAEN